MRALVVYKRSKYDFYSSSPDAAVRKYVSGQSEHAQRIRESHAIHQRSLENVLRTLDNRGITYESIWRADLKRANGCDLVIAVGGDGTFLDASHYVRGAPMLGVNSDPPSQGHKGSVGYFCATDAEGFPDTFDRLEALSRTTYNRLELSKNGVLLPEPALNDVLFADINPAAFTYYRFNGTKVRSNGMVACAPGGSTARMKNLGGAIMLPDDIRIQYRHRDVPGAKPDFALAISLVSETREGRIYVDGQHLAYDLALGDTLDIRSGSPLTVLGQQSRPKCQAHTNL